MEARDGGTTEFSYPYKCKGRCRGDFTANADDVRVGYSGANYGGYHPTRGYFVQCPRCGTPHGINSNKLPESVRQKADEKEEQQK